MELLPCLTGKSNRPLPFTSVRARIHVSLECTVNQVLWARGVRHIVPASSIPTPYSEEESMGFCSFQPNCSPAERLLCYGSVLLAWNYHPVTVLNPDQTLRGRRLVHGWYNWYHRQHRVKDLGQTSLSSEEHIPWLKKQVPSFCRKKT